MAWTLTIGGTNVGAYVRPFKSMKVTSRGYQGVGTFACRLVEQTPYTLNILNESVIDLQDGATKLFGGYVRKRNRTDLNAAGIRVWEIEGQDFSVDPSDDWVPVGTGPRAAGETDKARIEWLFSTFGTRGVLAVSQSTVQVIKASMPEQNFDMMTLSQALDEICTQTGAQWYVDFNRILHYFVTEVTVAPFNVDVQAPNNTTTFPCRDFEYPDDTIDYVNEVQVVGYGVNAVRYRGGTAPAAGTRRLKIIRDTELLTVADCQAAGDAYLALENVRSNGKMKVWRAGLRAGQLIHIKNTQWSIDADFRIAEVTPNFLDPGGQAIYDVTFGSNPVKLSDLWNKQAGSIAEAGRAADTSLNYASQFLVGRVKVVSSLPTLPDTDYPIGQLVLLTTDEKLYRNPDDIAWTPSVAAVDVTGQIGTTQIADDAISTPKIAAGAVEAENIAAGAITSDLIAANAIVAGHITAGAVGADALAAEIVLADKLLTTGIAGARVEIDDLGIRNYNNAEKLMVRIPTDGTPVTIVGEIEASSLVSTTSADLRGANQLAAGSVTTAQYGVIDPTAAPTVAVGLPTPLTLATSPPDPYGGVCYDALGGSGQNTPVYYVGANPETGNLLDLAYEYRASDGVLLRTLRKTGTTTTTTTTVGSTSHISDSVEATSLDDQVSTPLTPTHDGNATKVSAYFYGYGGSGTGRVMIWTSGGTLKKLGPQMSIPSSGMTLGGSQKFTGTFATPEPVNGGTTYRVGFCRDDGGGLQWDRDDGSGKTTYKGNGGSGSYASSSTDSSHKPNVYMTYEYEVDSSVEGAVGPIVGVARITGSDIIWVLDDNGYLYKYNVSGFTYQTKVTSIAASIPAPTRAGLFYDGTNLIVVCQVANAAGTQVKFIKLDKTTGALVSNNNATGLTIDGTTAVMRGGVNNGGNYWVTVNGVVYAFSNSTFANVANRDFGDTNTTGAGVAFDGTYFRGWSAAARTKIYQFTNWDWSTSVMDFWVCYSWYDITGTTHETAVSPRVKITPGRRRQATVSQPAIPGGAAEPPDRVRVYMVQSASDPGGTGYKLQVTDALTSRVLSTYASGGAANPASNNFPAGNAASIKSAQTSPGWELKGDGTARIDSIVDGLGSVISPTSFVPVAAPPGWAATSTQTTANNFNANGGARAIQIIVPGPMRLVRYLWMNTDTASARSAEFALYKDVDSNTLQRVTGTDATWSLTPSASGRRYSNNVSGNPLFLAPGVYWLVIRNTHATNTLGVGYVAAGTLGPGINMVAPTTTPALGATIDISGWTFSDAIFAVLAMGEVFAATQVPLV